MKTIIVLDLAGHSVPIEIKSAATLSTALFKGIEQFMKIMPSAQHPALVYDGTQHHQQRGAQVLNFRDINEQLKTL